MNAIRNKCLTLGVIGGLGPWATAYFYELVVRMTAASSDQEHLPVLINSRPDIADRTRYILGLSDDNPLPAMSAIGRQLAAQGAERIAIPCVTAHYFYRQLQADIPVPLIDMIAETAQYLQRLTVKRVGLLATDGTISSGMIQKACQMYGIEVIIPDAAMQKNVMHLIYDNVKADKPIEYELFSQSSDHLLEQGADKILLACTELSLIRRQFPTGQNYIDVMAVLARAVVEACGAAVRNDTALLIGG